MQNAEALRVNNLMDERFKTVRAWIADHPEAAPKLRHLDVHFKAWDDYQADNPLMRDPTMLLGFEGELAQVEAESARYGYIPGEHIAAGDLVSRIPGGETAQAISDAADEAEAAAGAAVKAATGATAGAAKRVPWYVWAGGAAAAVGAVGLGVAYIKATLGPLADLARPGNNRGRRY